MVHVSFQDRAARMYLMCLLTHQRVYWKPSYCGWEGDYLREGVGGGEANPFLDVVCAGPSGNWIVAT